MKRLGLVLFLLLVVDLSSPTFGRVYKYDIHRKMGRNHRLWRGMSSNTGKNFGGWLVYIKNNNDATIVCCGAYYSPILVITSANCIHPYAYDTNMSVEPTAKARETDDHSFALIDTIYFPPTFQIYDQYMDIALIRLNRPIRGKALEFIGLHNGPIPDGTPLMTIGWGFDSLDVQMMSSVPLNTTVTKQNKDECLAFYRHDLVIDTIFCALQQPNSRLCRYDGGCPVLYKNKLAGVVSFGPQCRDTRYPSLYTNISETIAWIQDIEHKILTKELVTRRL